MGGKKIVHCVLVLFVQIRWAGFLKIVHCTLCASTICTNKVGGFSKNCTLCVSTICTNKVGGFSNFFITVGQKCIVTTKCIKKLNTKLQLLFKKI